MKKLRKNKEKYIKYQKEKIIISVLVIIIISLTVALFILYPFKKKEEHNIVFVIYYGDTYKIEYGKEYIEPGVKALDSSTDISAKIKTDTSNLNSSTLGKYKVEYSVVVEGVTYLASRIVNVVDTTKPKISLNGEDEVILLIGEEYKEEGAKANDNYDGDITSKIVTEGEVNTKKEGEYTVTYKVADTSNNTSEVKRKVTVNKPKEVKPVDNSENKETVREVVATNYSNTITKNNFTSSGFYIEGYKKNNDGNFSLTLEGNENYMFSLTNLGGGNYKGNIDLSNVSNGKYDIYIKSGENSERLVSKLATLDRINRSKVGNKLVSLTYSDGNVSVTISDFAYQYDVLIDPGHGGYDSGASNKYVYEKDLNLKVSLYEKCRYESHGFSVYMTRSSDTYGSGLGDSSMVPLQKRAYEMGYYGVVSKIVYSNHHNAGGSPSYMGYEILLPGYLTKNDLANELNIVSKFNSIYPLTENHTRFYARDYDTEAIYSKLDGQVYTFKDNYAVNRIPYKLFNTKAIIFEASYLSNEKDFNWYWKEKNWIKVSEAKLEVYINSLGGSYNPDNSSCL